MKSIPSTITRRTLCGAVTSAALLAWGAAGVHGQNVNQRPTLEVQADQVVGKLNSGAVLNFGWESAFGQTTSTTGEPALQWIRASENVRYVRAYAWLDDGIHKDAPEQFSGTRVYREEAGGAPKYNFWSLTHAIDALISTGARPYLVMGLMPDALAKGPVRRSYAGGATNVPKDYARYQQMIEATLRHLVKTYGAQEVRSWYFEVWNEPDNAAFWEGGRSLPASEEYPKDRFASFARLYDHFAAAAQTVDPQLRVGGPGLAGDRSFLRLFLEHCARGTNAVGGKPGAKLDFISWHHYAEPAEILRAAGELRTQIARDYPELAKAELHVNEWGTPRVADEQPGGAPYSVTEAAQLCALLDGSTGPNAPVARFVRWGSLADDHFKGWRPLVTRLGKNTVPLPVFRAAQFIGRMGPDQVATKQPETQIGSPRVIAARTGKDTAQALVYRYTPAGQKAETTEAHLWIRGLSPKLQDTSLRVYRVDSAHHNPYAEWVAAGKPDPAPAELGQKLAGDQVLVPAQDELSYRVRNGSVTVTLPMEPNCVWLVTVGKEEEAEEPKLQGRAKRVLDAEKAYYRAAGLQFGRNYERAADAYEEIAKKYADVYWSAVALATVSELYDADLKQPEKAEAARERFLALDVDDFERDRVLRQRLVAALRTGNTAQSEALQKSLDALQARVRELRRWDAPAR